MEVFLNGCRLHYEDRGKGTPLVLLHAFPFHSGMWQAQAEALQSSYRVIMPDMRGLGGSPLCGPTSSVADMAKNVLALVDALGYSNFILGGLSLGGYIAFEVARLAPSRISALILAATRAEPDAPKQRETREERAQLVEKEGLAALIALSLPSLLSPLASEATRALTERIMAQNSAAGVAAGLRALAQRHDSRDLLPTLTIPTLVIGGENDATIPIANMRTMHQAIPNSQFVSIEQAGHMVNLEQPERFNTALLRFLQSLSAEKPAPPPPSLYRYGGDRGTIGTPAVP